MFNLSLLNGMESIVEIIGNFDPRMTTICTDSREYRVGQLFIAISGENFDAFKFVPQLLKDGCKTVVFEFSDDRHEAALAYKAEYPDTCLIACKNVTSFFAELANKRIVEWKLNGGIAIGITGSNGKTTHKEMLYHFLNAVYPGEVTATQGNLNNHYGVPFTILKIEDTHRFAIIEMGSNHPGEIQYLANIALPDSGIITNIGDSHLEFFHNRENVFKEKRALFDTIACTTSSHKVFVCSGDDPFLNQLEKYEWSVKFGEKSGDVKVSYVAGEISIGRTTLKNANIVGRHNFMNLAGCYLLAQRLIGNDDLLIEAAQSFAPKMNRSELLQLGSAKVFLDAYNANPSSMEAALASIIEDRIFDPKQALFVLGDMNELGESAPDLHFKTGEFCAALGVENIIFIGRYAEHYLQGWGKPAQSFKNTAELLKIWPEMARNYPQIFIKGSRTLQLESLADIKYYNE